MLPERQFDQEPGNLGSKVQTPNPGCDDSFTKETMMDVREKIQLNLAPKVMEIMKEAMASEDKITGLEAYNEMIMCVSMTYLGAALMAKAKRQLTNQEVIKLATMIYEQMSITTAMLNKSVMENVFDEKPEIIL